jgi:hypothetical protein
MMKIADWARKGAVLAGFVALEWVGEHICQAILTSIYVLVTFLFPCIRPNAHADSELLQL